LLTPMALCSRLAGATPGAGAASFAAKEKAGDAADVQRGSGGPHDGGGGGASGGSPQRTVVL